MNSEHVTIKIKFNTIDEYLFSLPQKSREILKKLRTIIKEAAPEAEEVISYNMPAFRFYGMLVYYAAHKEHVGFYPGSSMIINLFKDDLSPYETSKGTIKFPFDNKLPVRLITKIVKFRVRQNLEKAEAKKGLKGNG